MTEQQLANLARNATKIAISRYGDDVTHEELCDEVVGMLIPRIPDSMPVEELHDVVAEAVDEVL